MTITSAQWANVLYSHVAPMFVFSSSPNIMTSAQSPNTLDVLDFNVMQLCTAYTLYTKIHIPFAYFPSLFLQLTTLTILFVLVNIMAPSTRRNKRRSPTPEDPDLAAPRPKRLKFRRSKGGDTPSLVVTFPHSAKEYFTGPDGCATPSLTVTFSCSAEEHPTRSHSTEGPPARARRGRPPRDKQNLRETGAGPTPLNVIFPCSTEEYPTRSHSTEGPPAKARRGRPPRNKPKAPLIVNFPSSPEDHITEPNPGATPSLLVPFPYSTEEQPTRFHFTESLPTKAPRGKPPRNKQKADQQNDSSSVDARPKSWGMPEVWAEVFH